MSRKAHASNAELMIDSSFEQRVAQLELKVVQAELRAKFERECSVAAEKRLRNVIRGGSYCSSISDIEQSSASSLYRAAASPSSELEQQNILTPGQACRSWAEASWHQHPKSAVTFCPKSARLSEGRRAAKASSKIYHPSPEVTSISNRFWKSRDTGERIYVNSSPDVPPRKQPQPLSDRPWVEPSLLNQQLTPRPQHSLSSRTAPHWTPSGSRCLSAPGQGPPSLITTPVCQPPQDYISASQRRLEEDGYSAHAKCLHTSYEDLLEHSARNSGCKGGDVVGPSSGLKGPKLGKVNGLQLQNGSPHDMRWRSEKTVESMRQSLERISSFMYNMSSTMDPSSEGRETSAGVGAAGTAVKMTLKHVRPQSASLPAAISSPDSNPTIQPASTDKHSPRSPRRLPTSSLEALSSVVNQRPSLVELLQLLERMENGLRSVIACLQAKQQQRGHQAGHLAHENADCPAARLSDCAPDSLASVCYASGSPAHERLPQSDDKASLAKAELEVVVNHLREVLHKLSSDNCADLLSLFRCKESHSQNQPSQVQSSHQVQVHVDASSNRGFEAHGTEPSGADPAANLMAANFLSALLQPTDSQGDTESPTTDEIADHEIKPSNRKAVYSGRPSALAVDPSRLANHDRIASLGTWLPGLDDARTSSQPSHGCTMDERNAGGFQNGPLNEGCRSEGLSEDTRKMFFDQIKQLERQLEESQGAIHERDERCMNMESQIANLKGKLERFSIAAATAAKGYHTMVMQTMQKIAAVRQKSDPEDKTVKGDIPGATIDPVAKASETECGEEQDACSAH